MPDRKPKTDLSEKMHARANADGLPAAHELRTRAVIFDAAAQGYYADPQTVPVQAFMSAWAKARRAWCLYSGEPMI
jgi:hypothetical protein